MSVKIIAEAGCNHNGKIHLALKMVREAKKACADAIKFQMYNPDQLVTKNAKKAKIQRIMEIFRRAGFLDKVPSRVYAKRPSGSNTWKKPSPSIAISNALSVLIKLP